MSNELKNCPFCTGDNIESRVCDYGIDMRGKPWLAGCRTCKIHMEAYPSEAKIKGYRTAQALAEEKWNRRAESDIEKAHREGRVIVLPVPVGKAVYFISDAAYSYINDILTGQLTGYFNRNGQDFYEISDGEGMDIFQIDEIFLTREAAEAVLKERENHD